MAEDEVVLYLCLPSRSSRVVWLLEELEQPYKAVILDWADTKTPEFLASKHPMGLVPVCVVNGKPVFESGAIVQFLLERFGQGRLEPPPNSPLRADYLKWLWYAEATLQQPLTELNKQTMSLSENRIPGMLPLSRDRALQRLGPLETALQGREFLVGDELSAADIMTVFCLTIAFKWQQIADETSFPNLARYYAAMSTRPAFKKAVAVTGE